MLLGHDLDLPLLKLAFAKAGVESLLRALSVETPPSTCGSGLVRRTPRVGPRPLLGLAYQIPMRGLFRRRLYVVKTGDSHLVEASVHLLRRDQISHRGFERLMPVVRKNNSALRISTIRAIDSEVTSTLRSRGCQCNIGRASRNNAMHLLATR